MSNGQLRSIVDRILRLKAEQDDLAKDIREIYAEAKSSGFDKTALGKVVSHVRKREKLGADQMAEVESVFDTYLHAYLGTGIAHAHTHETEQQVAPHSAQSQAASAVPGTPSTGQGGDESPVNNSQSEAVHDGPSNRSLDTGSDEASDDAAGVEAPAASVIQFNRDETTEERCLRLRPHCQNPSGCGSSVWNKHCFTCTKAVTSLEGGAA